MFPIITLIIAHGHTLFIQILQRTLLSHPGFHILGKAASAAELKKIVTAFKADIIIADIALPGMLNIADLQKIAASIQAKVIISWWHKDKALMKEALAAGFPGYIINEASTADYKDAVQKVQQGKTYKCMETQKLAGLRCKGTPADPAFKTMTSKKYQLIAYGLLLRHSLAEIATATKLTSKSAKTYKQRLKDFLGTLSDASLRDYLQMAGNKLIG